MVALLRLEHPKKQNEGIISIDDGMVISVRDVQFENAEVSREVQFSVIVTDFRLVQSLKAFDPTGALTQMLVSDEQAPKAWLPIAVTDDGIVT